MDLPVLSIVEDNLPAAWEEAVLSLWESGRSNPCQYQSSDVPMDSRDCVMSLTIKDPFAEPRIHLAMPCGLEELEMYVQEVIDGVHDHWIDPAHGKWQYSYHERMASYKVPGIEKPINQLDYVVNALIDCPYTRRAQISMWKPWEDEGIPDPACLQNLWFRIFDDTLVLVAHMRSNDSFTASFMNMYAFTELQKVVAERVSKGLGREIKVGQYTHLANSFHIYEKDFRAFVKFMELQNRRSFEDRTWNTADPDIAEQIVDAKNRVTLALQREKETGRKGL